MVGYHAHSSDGPRHHPSDMPPSPRVSILTPFLNTETFIGEAVESVLSQSLDSWELLLIDDGSTDGSREIARGFASRFPDRIRSLDHPNNEHRGVSAARNLGLRHARGQYLAFLDSDDVYFSHKLSQQVSILDSLPSVSMLYGNTRYWYGWNEPGADPTPDFVPDLGVPLNCVIEPPTLLTLLYPLGIVTAPSLNTVMVRREVAERLGGFVDAFALAYSDQSLLVKLYLTENVYVVNECWDRYRQHAGSSSSIVEETGQYQAIRQRFLRWMKNYLSAMGISDPTIQQALEKVLVTSGPERH